MKSTQSFESLRFDPGSCVAKNFQFYSAGPDQKFGPFLKIPGIYLSKNEIFLKIKSNILRTTVLMAHTYHVQNYFLITN